MVGEALFQNRNPNDLANQLMGLLSDDNLAREIGLKHVDFAKKSNWETAARTTLKNYKITMKI